MHNVNISTGLRLEQCDYVYPDSRTFERAMPALLCVKENENAASLSWKISTKDAGDLLFRYKPKFSDARWILKGPARPLPTQFVECDRYVIHLESELGNFAPGYYLFGDGKPTPTELAALVGK